MKAPTQYIHKWSWDILIVLDACRYDYYEKFTPFKGELLKLEVESSDTQTWLTMNFPSRYPYVYVSANPFCNSKIKVGDFLGLEHFKKVIDVWEFGWDDELKTVPPREVTKASLPYLKNERVIIHYMQPHFPSIGKIRVTFEAWKPDPLNTIIDGVTYPKHLPPLDIIKEAYKENLQIVLKEIKANLLPKIPKNRKVVITSDHGEFLGENGRLFHPCVKHPVLNTVFWHEIRNL